MLITHKLFTLFLGLMCLTGMQKASAAKEIYAALEGNTMTIYYDDQKASRSGVLNEWGIYAGTSNVPDATRQTITAAVIDGSMVDARPESTQCWFTNLKNMTSITGMSNLNTSSVTTMQSMFYNCAKLGSISLSGFNTEKVTNMSLMFSGCSTLTTLDLSSFKTGKVTTMSYMFKNCWALKTLDLGGFNTENVEYMHEMFSGCEKLEALDLSKFKTDKVKKMDYMFNGCYKLASLDVSKFNTANVTDMRDMFNNCKALTTLDVSKFNTANVTDMQSMFYNCLGVTVLDVSNFNTANVVSMYMMFGYCKAITTLDLCSFNIDKVGSLKQMFYYCTALKTIYCEKDWSTSTANSDRMFQACIALVGDHDTHETDGHMDKEYARPDEGTAKPGYFSRKPKDIYAVLESGTMTIYYDSQKASRSNVLAEWNAEQGAVNVAEATLNMITSVVVDATMASARPEYLENWFRGMGNMSAITGLNNLNTSEVVNMNNAFYNCTALTALNLSSFNTEKVTSMLQMFANCSALKSLNISNFNTSKVTSMSSMFFNCNALTSLDLSSFNTANVTKMLSMFMFCASLKSLDLSKFNTANVTSMESMFRGCSGLTVLDLRKFDIDKLASAGDMFYGCSALKTIYSGTNWSASAVLTDSEDMFAGCSALVGEEGTAYDVNHTDAAYAHQDGGTANPGYFTLKPKEIYAALDGSTMTIYYDTKKETRGGVLEDWNAANGANSVPEATLKSITTAAVDASMANARPTGLHNWFKNMENMTAITGLTNLNTSEVTVMYRAFFGCKALTALDLSGFNTANVTSMQHCAALTELDLGGFTTDNLTTMNFMFQGCTKLATINLSSFNTANVENMSGVFSDCNALTVLDLRHFNTDNVERMSQMFAGCTKLKTILCEKNWGASATLMTSDDMFYGCSALVGEKGTKYDINHVTAAYARLDEGESYPGYFSKDIPSGMEEIFKSSNSQIFKFFRGGQLYILRDGKVYTPAGQEVK